jgi:hypothetical protein
MNQTDDTKVWAGGCCCLAVGCLLPVVVGLWGQPLSSILSLVSRRQKRQAPSQPVAERQNNTQQQEDFAWFGTFFQFRISFLLSPFMLQYIIVPTLIVIILQKGGWNGNLQKT